MAWGAVVGDEGFWGPRPNIFLRETIVFFHLITPYIKGQWFYILVSYSSYIFPLLII